MLCLKWIKPKALKNHCKLSTKLFKNGYLSLDLINRKCIRTIYHPLYPQ
jgi:hypothetical protein